jgi:hypothetical protein
MTRRTRMNLSDHVASDGDHFGFDHEEQIYGSAEEASAVLAERCLDDDLGADWLPKSINLYRPISDRAQEHIDWLADGLAEHAKEALLDNWGLDDDDGAEEEAVTLAAAEIKAAAAAIFRVYGERRFDDVRTLDLPEGWWAPYLAGAL